MNLEQMKEGLSQLGYRNFRIEVITPLNEWAEGWPYQQQRMEAFNKHGLLIGTDIQINITLTDSKYRQEYVLKKFLEGAFARKDRVPRVT